MVLFTKHFRLLELRDTESAHKEALEELNRMKEAMDKMEEERSEMIAEVEAQIERALAHMAVDMEESDYGSSRPSSRLSSRSAPTLRRRPSDTVGRPLRSFSTESTLAESYNDGKEDGLGGTGIKTVPEVEEEEEELAPSKKRFSASKVDLPQDGMTAVDEGISQKSDKIAQKVLQIQRKVCSIRRIHYS